MSLELPSLTTPALIVDRPTLVRNAAMMREKAGRHGVRLRPHVKTHKVPAIATLQLEGMEKAITVSTMAEARAFFAHGFSDVTYAVPVGADKLPEAVDLLRRGARLGLLFDHAETLANIVTAARGAGVRPRVWLKIDCGYHRAGVDPEDPRSLALAISAARQSADVEWAGILTHSGQAYGCQDAEGAASVAARERDVMVRFGVKLGEHGMRGFDVSIGSTPAVMHAQSFAGATEIRPGNYIFFDKFQADVGACRLEDCAVSVLTSVIGHYPERGQLVVDAGALALSKDAGATHVDAGTGYGAVLGHPQLKVEALSQEHGILRAGDEDALRRVAIGDKLRIVPNHSCLTAAMFPTFHVVDGERIVDEWQPVRGW